MFGANDNDQPDDPVTSEEFKESLSSYAGETYEERIGAAVDSLWPVVKNHDEPPVVKPRSSVSESDISPTIADKDEYEWFQSYREHQRETVVSVIKSLYIEDNDVTLLSAPTGAGKSLLIYASVMVVNEITGNRGFTTTPLNTLIDQIDNDEFLDDVITVKGRNNYSCVHPEDAGTSVDNAICQRDSNFECQYKEQHHERGGCPYYGRVNAAQSKPNVVTNLSYLMANSMIPDAADAGFSSRELLAVDETQGVESFVLMFVGFTVGPNSVPIDWDKIDSMPSESADMDSVIEWVEDDLMRVVIEKLEELESKSESGFMMSQKQQDQMDELRRFRQRVSNFLDDVRNHHWTRTHNTFAGSEKIEFEPIFVGRFLKKYLWSQGNKILCASATIPPSFVEEAGFDDSDVGRVEVPSTFPAERRPVITTEDVGKMSYHERDKTMPKMADQIARIADLWDGHKGFVHCNSYSIAEKIYNRLPNDVKNLTRLQDGDDREGSLDEWMEAPVNQTGVHSDEGGQVFLSVAMDEGISLDDDLSRWQVVAKASYPHMQDERVSYRMDKDTMGGADWSWYSSKAAINLQQAVGRGMRSKDDWCCTYLLDSSLITLIERNKYLFEDWFLEAVDCDYDASVVSPENGGSDSTEEVSRKSTSSQSLDEIADDFF